MLNGVEITPTDSGFLDIIVIPVESKFYMRIHLAFTFYYKPAVTKFCTLLHSFILVG